MIAVRLLRFLSLSSALAASACVADPGAAGEFVATSNESIAVHMLPLHTTDAVSDAAPLGSHLMNFGGPTLQHIQVAPLYWNASVQFQSNLNLLYSDLVVSPWWHVLAQYGVGPGSGRTGSVDNRTATSVRDSAVQTELLNQINAGHVPPPNANTYYPVHFPPGVTITAPDGSQSCVVFCAYHSTFQVSGPGGTVNVNYGVIPDQGGGCAGGCGNNPSRFNNLSAVSSGELANAATDPVFGTGWFDPNLGEVASICGSQGTTTVNGRTYVVPLLFSNATNSCVAQ